MSMDFEDRLEQMQKKVLPACFRARDRRGYKECAGYAIYYGDIGL